MEKLSTIPYEETKHLVKKFFAKIIDLKETEHKKQGEIGELQVSHMSFYLGWNIFQYFEDFLFRFKSKNNPGWLSS